MREIIAHREIELVIGGERRRFAFPVDAEGNVVEERLTVAGRRALAAWREQQARPSAGRKETTDGR
jgi:hypothetical protein